MNTLDTCEPYFEYVRRYVDLDPDTMELVASNTGLVTIPPKEFILHEGSKCEKVYFVVSGAARSYYTDFSGKTITWAFHFNDEKSISRNLFALDYRSLLTGLPSVITIETVSEFKAITFTKAQLAFLIENSHLYERWMRRLNELAYAHMFDRAFTMLTMSATERYQKLLKEEPYLLQMFSNYYVASYLGIAPQSLSRIRSQH